MKQKLLLLTSILLIQGLSVLGQSINPSSISEYRTNDPSITSDEMTEAILNQTIEEIGAFICTNFSDTTIVFEKVLNEVNHAIQDSLIFNQFVSEFLPNGKDGMEYSKNINFLFDYDEIIIYDIDESVNIETYEFITKVMKYPIASRMIDIRGRKFLTIANSDGKHEFWDKEDQDDKIIIKRGDKVETGFAK